MKKELQELKGQLQKLRDGEVRFFTTEELNAMLSTIDQTMEELENTRKLDQPSEALIDSVAHLIEVENSTEDDDGRFSLDDLNEAWERVQRSVKEARASLHWSDDKLKEVIASRIRDEFKKYGSREDMDWARIAAAKIVGTTRDVLGGFITLRLIKAGNDCAIALNNLSDILSKDEREKAIHLYNQWQMKKSALSDLSIFYELRSTKRLCDTARDYLKNPSQDNEEALRLSIEQVEGKKSS